MKGGGIVQADEFAQLGEPDALAVPRDLLEDGEGAAERLHAGALAFLRLVIDVGLRRRHELRHVGLVRIGQSLAGLDFDT